MYMIHSEVKRITVKPFVYSPQMTEISPNLGGGLDNGYKIFELFFRKSIF